MLGSSESGEWDTKQDGEMYLLNEFGLDLNLNDLEMEIVQNLEIERLKGKFFTKECIICQESMKKSGLGRTVKLSCGHSFHSICLNKWISTKPNCPLCLKKIS